MLETAQVTVDYDVSVDHATLKLVGLGTPRAGCQVQLTGAIDERWIEAYQTERRQSRTLSRFDLEPSTGTVWFARGPGSDPADVIDALETLDALVARVSDRVTQAAR